MATITNPADRQAVSKAQNAYINATEDLRQAQKYYPSKVAEEQAKVAQTRAELLKVTSSAESNATAASTTPQNSGQNVAQAQQARDNGAPIQNPPPASIRVDPITGRVVPANAAPATNATGYSPNANTGTNAPNRSLTNTQTVPPPTAQPTLGGTLLNYGSAALSAIAAAAPSIARGDIIGGIVAAAGGAANSLARSAFDDYGNNVKARINQIAKSGNNSKVTPQPNVLDKYSSYTYNISLYMLSPKDYVDMVNKKTHAIPGAQLLMQTGGAPMVDPNTKGQPGRNQFFPLDYYLDEVKVTSLMPGKGTRSPHSAMEVTFRIIEPNGISLLDNLYQAIKQYTGKTENYNSQNYLMVISFYGYDQLGNLVKASAADQFTSTGLADKTAIVEKYIPFRFTNIKFRIANKLTEYECSAVAIQNSIATGQAWGTIPYNVELTATTVGDLFGGKAKYGTTDIDIRESTKFLLNAALGKNPAPPKASSAPKKTIITGLVEALNQYEKEHVDDGIFDVANDYNIIFTDDIIASADTVPPGSTDKSKTPMNSGSSAAQQKNPATQSMDPNSKNTSATAGTQILQFIDQTIKTSTYISSQQKYIVDPNSQELIPNGGQTDAVGWYRVGLQATPKEYDYKRNDYAYSITYQISPYLVSNIQSPWFYDGVFRGVQKQYDYWFTGTNTEILSYEQNFNALFFMVANTPQAINTLDYREVQKYMYQTRSNESDQGNEGKVNEGGASAADRLYSPGDLSEVKISIVGDPGWLIQGEVWSGVAGTSFSYDPFLPDGTINTESQEALFEIRFNKPVDYDIQTGVMDPAQRIQGANAKISRPPNAADTGPTQSYVYKTKQVVSVFAKGKFTQDIDGVLINFPIADNKAGTKTNAANGRTTTNAAGAATSVTRDLSGNASVNSKGFLGGTGVPGVKGLATKAIPNTTNYSGGTSSTAQTPEARAAAAVRGSPPAKAPTVGGNPVGSPSATTNTNPQTGGTRQTDSTTIQMVNGGIPAWSAADPAAWQQYRDYQQAQYNTIYNERVASLTAQAKRNTKDGVVPADEVSRINTSSRFIAESQSMDNALLKYADQIAAAGFATKSTSTSTTTTPTTRGSSQPMNLSDY